jgi:hypothetical protein
VKPSSLETSYPRRDLNVVESTVNFVVIDLGIINFIYNGETVVVYSCEFLETLRY